MLPKSSNFETLSSSFRWQVPKSYNIAAVISDFWSQATPNRLAIRHINTGGIREDWSHLALNRAANKFANALKAQGVNKGDRVALLLPQCPETAIAHIAIYKLGAIAVPLAVLFGLGALSFRLADSGAKVLITNTASAEKVSQVRDDLPDLQRIISVEQNSPNALSFSSLMETSSESFDTLLTSPNCPALMIYTSGTTGQPKGVLHGHRVLLGHMPGIELSQNFLGQEGDLLWTPADWAWAGGLLNALFPALSLGVPVVSHAFKKFDPDYAFHILESERIRNAFIPPTALRMLRTAYSSSQAKRLVWRSVGSAGEALGRETYDWFQEAFGFAANEFYGQTECNTVLGSVASLKISQSGSIGKTTPGHEVAIIDADGQSVPTGDLGQIAVKRPDPVMFLEYWNNPEATKDKFIGDWMVTGDQGQMDEEGYVSFVGRDDDIITSAGYRIGPTEIEDCLLKHPSVSLAAAIGKPDPLRTEIVKAFIVVKASETPNEALKTEIQSFVKKQLSAHEYPREIEFVDALPMTTTGKIVRRELREKWI